MQGASTTQGVGKEYFRDYERWLLLTTTVAACSINIETVFPDVKGPGGKRYKLFEGMKQHFKVCTVNGKMEQSCVHLCFQGTLSVQSAIFPA